MPKAAHSELKRVELRVSGYVLPTNGAMLKTCARVDFRATEKMGDPIVTMVYAIRA